jgi:gamma-glutamylcyclotransferase (GGCT)/AIG2-like uncharacterized protein YtfP
MILANMLIFLCLYIYYFSVFVAYFAYLINTDNANTKMIAIARTPYLKVRSGADAMSLMLSSERLYSDLLDWIRFGEPEQICLRIWESDLTLDNEFRVFVCNNRMTAISQYDHYTFYPDLSSKKDFLFNGIYDLWTTVHPYIGLPTYVIDIAYLPKKGTFVVIELSPFSPCTGPACFHWQQDKSVLQNGLQSPQLQLQQRRQQQQGVLDQQELSDKEIQKQCVEFRLKLECDIHSQLEDLVQLNWDARWAETRVPYDYYYKKTDNNSIDSVRSNSSNSSPSCFESLLRSFRFGGTATTDTTTSANSEQLGLISGQNQSPIMMTRLFVYGTLKSGFQWNQKYLHSRLGTRCIGPARTVDKMALVIGDSGVPYLLGDYINDSRGFDNNNDAGAVSDRRKMIVGELWEVSVEALQGLDDYEGLTKGYYNRVSIDIQLLNDNSSSSISGEDVVKADVYVLNVSTEDLKNREFIECYTVEIHNALYKPIQHIQVKQFNYFKVPSTWGKTQEIIAESLSMPKS